jgi:hypothetical protein
MTIQPVGRGFFTLRLGRDPDRSLDYLGRAEGLQDYSPGSPEDLGRRAESDEGSHLTGGLRPARTHDFINA